MLGEPEEQLGALVYLVSGIARYFAGAAIVVDRGATLLGAMRPPSRSAAHDHQDQYSG